MPRRVRRGQRARVRLHLQVVRGAHITRSFRLRIPASMRPGRRHISFLGHNVDDPDSDLLSTLIETITLGGGDEDKGDGDPGARSLAALARRVRAVGRYDGVTARAGGRRMRAYRDADLRISGRGSATVRVRR
jgi:hypothetical protein